MSLVGFRNDNVSLDATYAVDNNGANFFPSLNLNDSLGFGTLVEVKGLTPGPHRLNILYTGDGTKPLNISYFLFQNGSSVPVPSSSTTIHRKPTIIGGVTIGLVLISFLLNIVQSQVL